MIEDLEGPNCIQSEHTTFDPEQFPDELLIGAQLFLRVYAELLPNGLIADEI